MTDILDLLNVFRQKLKHLLSLSALPMVLESVAEGEDKDIDSSEEKTVAKPPAKEEVETPELKVTTMLPSLLTII